MTRTAPVAVSIPTYKRGAQVLTVLEKIEKCDPRPREILVHIDEADGILESELNRRFPNVRILTSPTRLGPGGGRHRCLLACKAPYVVSFDDDSYPVDIDFFDRVEQLFLSHPNAAIFAATIWHRHEPEKERVERLSISPDYTGCGFAVRLTAYQQTRGLLPRPVAYEMEEVDLSLQLFAAGWTVYRVGDLRVLHDTDLKHHESPEINAGAITNIGLFVFIHYPIIRWGSGFLRVGNRVAYSIRTGRFRGLVSGLLRIPIECYRNRHYRNPLDWRILTKFFEFRRAGKLHH